MGLKKSRQATGYPQIRIIHAINLPRGHELAYSFIELSHDKLIETDRVVQEPMESVDRKARHDTVSQSLRVVAIGLALQHSTLAEPAPRRNAGECYWEAISIVTTQFHQALDNAHIEVTGRPARQRQSPWSASPALSFDSATSTSFA